MEPEGSLPFLQEPSTGHYPEPNQRIYMISAYFSKIQLYEIKKKNFHILNLLLLIAPGNPTVENPALE
jgi:hypothetical protein